MGSVEEDKNIRVAIVGVGNCAKALVEGVQYYTVNTGDDVGLMYRDIGGYRPEHIKFAAAFDIDVRKVNTPLQEALRAHPNCAMDHVAEISDLCMVEGGVVVREGPLLDGVPPHMADYPDDVTFVPSNASPLSMAEVVDELKKQKVDVVVNYLPVGSSEASKFYIDAALEANCHVVNCIPTCISTDEARELEQRFIDKGLTIVGSDMRSAFGASRLSEVLQGSMLDAGLMVTQHIQMNFAAGTTQGQEHVRSGVTANTDFLNMAKEYRLHSKHVSKENVLKGQNVVRNASTAGATLYAGPSLAVQQKPGGVYRGSDQKIANLDLVAFGFGGARYELTCRLAVQDSPNSGGVVVSAIRFCRVAAELGVVGYLRGASAYTQKSPPLQMTSADAKYECDALARRELTALTRPQLASAHPVAAELPYSFQSEKLDYASDKTEAAHKPQSATAAP